MSINNSYSLRAQIKGFPPEDKALINHDVFASCNHYNQKLFSKLLKGKDSDFWLSGHKPEKRNTGFSVGAVTVTTIGTIALAYLAQWAFLSAE